jgi:hypothetical protein
VTVAILYVAVAAGGALGTEWLWPPVNLTLSEAAAIGDAGEIARQIAAGVDPNRPVLVSRGFVNRDPVMLTPLEAAVEHQRPDIVDVLVLNGARVDASTIAPLRCAARQLHDVRTEAVLERYVPGDVDCAHVTLPPL